MNWLFLAWFGPITLASLVLCRQDSSLWPRLPSVPTFDLSRDDRREFSRFLRSQDVVPDRRIAPAVLAWAEVAERTTTCRWDRYLTWAWLLWFGAGVAAGFAFGNPRRAAVNFVALDVFVLMIAFGQGMRRRARAVLAGAGR